MPHFRPSSVSANFDIPPSNSGRGLTLTDGPGVGIYVDLQPPYTWPVHHHPVVQIVLALERVEVDLVWEDSVGRHELTYNGPHAWLLPANCPHAATWKGTATMVVLYIESEHIRAEFGREVTQGALLPLSYFTQRDYMVVGLCRNLRDLCHDRRPFSPTFVAASGGLLAPLILQTYLQPNDLRSRKIPVLQEERLRRVSDYIDTHLRDRITRSDLARVAGLAEHHFSRLFKNSAGLPPMKYVWRCRLYEARRLLESGDWKVAAAAAETGFCDQSHLDRQFRREFSCSPGSVIPGGPR